MGRRAGSGLLELQKDINCVSLKVGAIQSPMGCTVCAHPISKSEITSAAQPSVPRWQLSNVPNNIWKYYLRKIKAFPARPCLSYVRPVLMHVLAALEESTILPREGGSKKRFNQLLIQEKNVWYNYRLWILNWFPLNLARQGWYQQSDDILEELKSTDFIAIRRHLCQINTGYVCYNWFDCRT